MPLVNYCKKCKTEVPNAGVCPYCGARLTKAGERLTVSRERVPVRDWFAWNAMLRIAVPVLVLVLFVTVLAEALTEGAAGVQAVFLQGFSRTLLYGLAALLLFTLALLLAQGGETVYCVLDREGAHMYTYLRSPRAVRLYARLLTGEAVETLQAEAPQAHRDGLTLVRRAQLPWKNARRAQYWPETHTVLLYNPRWWQAMCIRCGENEYAEVEAYVKSKLSRTRKRKKRRK